MTFMLVFAVLVALLTLIVERLVALMASLILMEVRLHYAYYRLAYCRRKSRREKGETFRSPPIP